jgi:hypothetical protein
LEGADFSEATYNESTRFPEGFDPEKYHMQLPTEPPRPV